jgi:hypothetical protein
VPLARDGKVDGRSCDKSRLDCAWMLFPVFCHPLAQQVLGLPPESALSVLLFLRLDRPGHLMGMSTFAPGESL